MLLRGGIIVLAGALAAIALASYGLQTYKFSPQSVTGFRIGVFAVFALLLGAWLIRPMRPQGVRPAGGALRRGTRAASCRPRFWPRSMWPAPPMPATRSAGRHRRQDGRAGDREGQDHRRRQAVGRVSMRRVRGRARPDCRDGGAMLLVVGPEFLRQGASALLVLSKSGGSRESLRHQRVSRATWRCRRDRTRRSSRAWPGSGRTTSACG